MDATDNDSEPAAERRGVFLPDVQEPERAGGTAEGGFATVAVGASAGGVEALQRLFASLPPDSGCAFVVLLHLAPDLPSQLVPVLARVTAMPVHTAESGQ
jgi:two-component system, chemotaxis family, CheB/CheR fusion protein